MTKQQTKSKVKKSPCFFLFQKGGDKYKIKRKYLRKLSRWYESHRFGWGSRHLNEARLAPRALGRDIRGEGRT